MIINRHIHHLLLTDGVVVIPLLGVLRVCRVPAKYDEGNAVWIAPSRKIVFERDFLADDTALELSLSRTQNISQQSARSNVLEYCSDLRKIISSGGRCEIGDLGFLKKDNSGDICFEGVHGVESQHTWFKSVNTMALEGASFADKEDRYSHIERHAMGIAIANNSFAKSLQRTASSAAALALFALLAFVFAQLPHRNTPVQQVASLGVEKIIAGSSDEEEIIEPTSTHESSLVLILNTPSDGTAPAKVRGEKAKSVHQDDEVMSKYCLVVASLASQNEAERYMAYHSNDEIPLQILNSDGHWRVYALGDNSIESLVDRAKGAGIYSKYPSAWVCRR